MAKNYSLQRSQVDKFTIKGVLSEDGANINYIDGDKEERVISVAQCLASFRGEDITLTVATKTEQDLSDVVENDDYGLEEDA